MKGLNHIMHTISQIWNIITSPMSQLLWLSILGAFIYYTVLNYIATIFIRKSSTKPKTPKNSIILSYSQLLTLAISIVTITILNEYSTRLMFVVYSITLINQYLPNILVKLPHKVTIDKTPYETAPSNKEIEQTLAQDRHNRRANYNHTQTIVNILFMIGLLAISYYYIQSHNYEQFIKLIKSSI